MKIIVRRLDRLADRFSPPVDPDANRRIREQIEAGQRRANAVRGVSESIPFRYEDISGLSVADILNRGRAKAYAQSLRA